MRRVRDIGSRKVSVTRSGLKFLHTDIAEKAGVTEVPTGQDEFKQMAAKMKEQDGVKWGISLQPGRTGSWQTVLPLAWSRGAEIADDKGYTVVGALPFDPAVTGAMIRRKALTETDSPLASTLSAIWGRIRELAYAPRKRG